MTYERTTLIVETEVLRFELVSPPDNGNDQMTSRSLVGFSCQYPVASMGAIDFLSISERPGTNRRVQDQEKEDAKQLLLVATSNFFWDDVVNEYRRKFAERKRRRCT